MTAHRDENEHASDATAAATDGSATRPDATTADESGTDSMGDVDHTHPHRNTTFGSIFGRGPTVAADGGVPAGAQDATSMADVSHESPTGTDPSGVFDRGAERSDGPDRTAATDTPNRGVANDE